MVVVVTSGVSAAMLRGVRSGNIRLLPLSIGLHLRLSRLDDSRGTAGNRSDSVEEERTVNQNHGRRGSPVLILGDGSDNSEQVKMNIKKINSNSQQISRGELMQRKGTMQQIRISRVDARP